uniref:hypothetical protein n=1 Tax=Herbidospora sakaeratensis TaxID=564415 RepID=UPI000A067BB7|nr:hypothetical protein [Herbidospora sakaeratensis]
MGLGLEEEALPPAPAAQAGEAWPIEPVAHEGEEELDEGRDHHKGRHHHHDKWHHKHHHHKHHHHKWHHHKWHHHGHHHHGKWHHRHHHRGWAQWGWKNHHKPHKFVKYAKKVKVKARKTWACRTMTAEATCAPMGDGTSQYVPGLGTLAVARLAL